MRGERGKTENLTKAWPAQKWGVSGFFGASEMAGSNQISSFPLSSHDYELGIGSFWEHSSRLFDVEGADLFPHVKHHENEHLGVNGPS